MRIIKLPPLSTEDLPSSPGTDDCCDLPHPDATDGAGLDYLSQSDHPAQSPGEMNRLYRQMELRLESVVERLLISKVSENDNLLASMQELMERVFVSSAMKMAEGNISRAARLLGINRNTLSKKLKAMEKL